jgi:hypothetical protein
MEGHRTTPASRVAVVAGFVLHGVVGVWVLLGQLIMPLWAVGILAVIWVVGLVLAFRWRARPALILLVLLVTLAIWFVTAWLGETFLDWTA